MRSNVHTACAILLGIAAVWALLDRGRIDDSRQVPEKRAASPAAPAPAGSAPFRQTLAAVSDDGPAFLNREKLEALFIAKVGDKTTLPLPRPVNVHTILVHGHDSGTMSAGFEFAGDPATTAHFARLTSGRIEGYVLSRHSERVLRIVSTGEGEAARVEAVAASDLLCARFEEGLLLPGMPPEPQASEADSAPNAASLPEPAPLLESRPGAPSVVFLSFDGETVVGTPWNTSYNGGDPIVAAPFAASEHIPGIWASIAEDYAVYDVNVTTDRARFEGAPPDRRVMVVFTPTRDWYGSSAGGVAFRGSFGSPTNPYCWVFNRTLNGAAEAGSHEIGHTVGLRHDGTSSRAYYTGHTHASGASWAPIMGSGYNRSIVQFSKGEYPNANRAEDDFAIMAGYLDPIPDDHGDSLATATAAQESSEGSLLAEGTIGTESDVDVFRFVTAATGTVSLSVSPHPAYRNLDAELELLDAAFGPLGSSAPEGPFDASVTLPALPPGTYYARVRGTGLGDLATGYPRYGSVGTYTLSGSYPGTPLPPAPAGFSASDGASPEFVALAWEALDGADGYAVYRNAAPTLAGADRIAEISGATSYQDRASRHGKIYWYFVRAVIGDVESEPTPLDDGFRLSFPLPVPASLSATRGAEPGAVLVGWSPVAGADHYLVYRSRDADPGEAEQIGESISTDWTDLSVEPGRSYRYFVRAESSTGISPFSESVLGYGAARDPLDDAFENNDDPEEATPGRVGPSPPRFEWRAVAVDGDPDWYALTLPPDRVRLDLAVPFDPGLGSVVVSLHDAEAKPLASGAEGAGTRFLSHVGEAGASYLLLVERDEGAAVPYRLVWTALRAGDSGLFPDLLVGPAPPPRRGEGVLNRNGSGQSLPLALPGRGTKRAFVSLVNRSAVTGSFAMRTTVTRWLEVHHARRSGERWTSVTAALRTGRAREVLPPLGSTLWQNRLRATPSSRSLRTGRAIASHFARGGDAPRRYDRVLLRLAMPRRR